MEHSDVERVDGTHVVVRVLLAVRAHLVPDWFSHTLEGQTYCDSGREQHGEPGEVRVVGFGVFEAQLNVTLLREEQIYQEEYPDLLCTHVDPGHLDRYTRLCLAEEFLELCGVQVAHDHEGPDQDRAGQKDYWVYCEAKVSTPYLEHVL